MFLDSAMTFARVIAKHNFSFFIDQVTCIASIPDLLYLSVLLMLALGRTRVAAMGSVLGGRRDPLGSPCYLVVGKLWNARSETFFIYG